MVSERQGWTNGKPFIVTAEQCQAKWGGGDRDWKLRCYLCRTEASEGDTFRWVYMNSSTPSPGNFMVCRTCDFDGIAEAVRASLEDWKKTFGDHVGWSFQAFSKFHSTLFERDQLRDELEAAKEDRDQLSAHVKRLRATLQSIWNWEMPETGDVWEDGTPMSYAAAYGSIGERRVIRNKAADALAATPAQSPETNSEQDFWARMQGPLVHCPNTASTSTGSSAAIELHAKQLREALETLNHAAKVAISSLYGSSLDEDTPLVIRLLDGTCDATDAVLAATPAQSLYAHDAWAVLEIGGEMDRNEVLERLLWMERWYESEANKGVHAPFATALRAAAELIRQGGWQPIAEVDAGEVIYAGKWNDRDEWQECWPIVADVAVSFGYTHHWPQMKKPEPPAQEVENG